MPLETEAIPRTNSPSDRAGGWWRKPFSVFQTNLQEMDAVLDVEQALDFIENYGSDTWLINTGGIVSSSRRTCRSRRGTRSSSTGRRAT